ncbi:hypothetical protein GLOIN_2v1766170 [Rhizophagus irregularis DAOM 181602=DAOM 197198]|uniref:Uncharacterized protein n=1 Tax=Rhizophagus irregularis (strain DAOM 181602 / DAOM 197198 / MUCL 43194) TaxID=747089 RepID=U9SNX0_RHIID|nr:hypothetical protein GLOIN_2v1766170 [Rhizophagus irregularis DAOM 181602=DAOM 197198]
MQLEASNTVIPDIEGTSYFVSVVFSENPAVLNNFTHHSKLNESLNNIISSNRLGETQVAPEILVWVSENICSFGKRKHTDQKLLVIRVISTYFTFIIYKTEIPCRVFEGT